MSGGRCIFEDESKILDDDYEEDGYSNEGEHHDDDDGGGSDDFHDDDILEIDSSDSPSKSLDFDDNVNYSEVEVVDEVIEVLQNVVLDTIREETDSDNIDNIPIGDIINAKNRLEVHQYIIPETESDSENLDDLNGDELDDDFDEDGYSFDYDGGYDDLYDDVMLEAGYDAWAVPYPEFDIDDEWDVLNNMHCISPVDGCYISLIMKVEEVLKLVGVWKNRKSQLCNQPTIKVDNDAWISAGELELNLFQVEKDLRLKLKMCSVSEIYERNFQKLEELAINIKVFLKDIVIQIIEKCLPYPLPSTVLRLIYSFLASTNGFGAFICLGSTLKESDDIFRTTEMMYCTNLFWAMDAIFKCHSQMLFFVYPHSKESYKESNIDWLECCSHNLNKLINKLKSLFTHDVFTHFYLSE